jgi:hypothetical protein
VPLYNLTCSFLDGGHMNCPTIDNRNWMFLQIGGRLFWDVTQTTTSIHSCSRSYPDSWTGEVHLVRLVRFIFRSKGYIRFALLRAKHFLTFKVWLPSTKFLYSMHLCHSDVQCLGVSCRSAESWATRSITFLGSVPKCSPLKNW